MFQSIVLPCNGSYQFQHPSTPAVFIAALNSSAVGFGSAKKDSAGFTSASGGDASAAKAEALPER